MPLSGSTYKPPVFSTDPVALSHVCSRWRHIAVNSVGLWSHIDLNPSRFRVARHLDRVKTYIARSSQTLLEVHIVDPAEEYLGGFIFTAPRANRSFPEFLASIAPRIQSLIMRSNQPPTKGYCHSVLFTCFTNCVPGRLVQLSLDVAHEFPKPPKNVDITRVGLSKATVEALWQPIQVLRLRQFYPVRTSKAYSGLVELHLICRGLEPPISESRLVAILKSSPGLRVFKINSEITRATAANHKVQPVPLTNLEQLSTRYFGEPHYDRLLRLIAPGPNLRNFTLANPWVSEGRKSAKQVTPSFRAVTENLFGSSSITRLYALNFDNYKQIEYILGMAPSVRVLLVDGCGCDQIPDDSALPSDFTLEELYVIRCTNVKAFAWHSIEQMVQKFRIQKLTLWWYDHRYNGLGESGEVVVPDNLHSVCPVVKIYTIADSNPIENWE